MMPAPNAVPPYRIDGTAQREFYRVVGTWERLRKMASSMVSSLSAEIWGGISPALVQFYGSAASALTIFR